MYRSVIFISKLTLFLRY